MTKLTKRKRGGSVVGSHPATRPWNLLTGPKNCSTCGKLKPLKAFPRRAGGTRSAGRRCKSCFNLYMRTLRRECPLTRKREDTNAQVRKAIDRGVLVRPIVCSLCEKEPINGVIAHHEDYSNPLDVTWLCYSCHRVTHNKE